MTEAGTRSTASQPSSISSMEATFQEFNRRVAISLLGSQVSGPQQRKPQPAEAPKPLQQPYSGGKRRREEDKDGAMQREKDDKSLHILMPNLGRARILCRLCSKRGLKTRPRYGCVQCRLGFHVECFAVFHHPERYITNSSDSERDALDVITGNSTSMPATRRRSIMSFEQLTLPASSDIQEI